VANYLVRVELFRANGEDYNDLHEKMAVLGLDRKVLFSDGKYYKLPIGTYFGSSNLEPGSLRDAVRSAADPLSSPRDASIFVCKSEDWSAFLYED